MLLDTREPQTYRAEVRRLLPDTPCQDTALPTGDYQWDAPFGRVIIERKELYVDLLHSIQGERWAGQCARLSELSSQGNLCIILIEGDMEFAGDNLLLAHRGMSRWTRNGILNALMVGQMRGVAITASGRGAALVAQRIASLYHLTRREVHGTTITHRKRVMDVGPQEATQLGILTGLPGCGITTARKLVEDYGSVYNVMNAIITQDSHLHKTVPVGRVQRWHEALTWRKENGRTEVWSSPG